MRNITVEPYVLEQTAAMMEQLNTEYHQNVSFLFEGVDLLAQSWQGKDNLAFTSQIKGFDQQMRQIYALCTQYIEFLRTSARAYRDTQNELISQANALRV
ncbi:MAG: WXG100 family type VII secretion target [Erysipelotrichaceae bacterium]|nr:WXG100 family type VII secretion target [Erysipelotrichaceae bacterium]